MSAYQRARNFLFPRSIAARLAEACAAVSKVKKLGNNGEYSYLRIVDIADAMRDELFSRGILIIPNDVEWFVAKFKAPDPAGRVITEVHVKTEFTVTDGKSEKVYAAYGVGRDMDGKALFAAQTGALKSWLKRLGLVFGDRDDPEVEARAEPREQQEADDELPRQKLAQARYQARAWTAALATCGRTEAEIEAILSKELGREVTSGTIIALPRIGFDIAMQILIKNSDLTAVIERSTRAAKRDRSRFPSRTTETHPDSLTKDSKGDWVRRSAPQPIVESLDHQPADEGIAG